ncbi:hypothetical protein AB0469_01480 [Streptomyces sp. NPDC093801]|uniref:hypothetical protein n=1 Tax=Streptomyces sp. NPDC093801 TaxID=3155203 RepID=UPI00344EEEBB
MTAATTTARSLLEQHGFAPTPDSVLYHPRNGLDKRGLLGGVAAAEAHSYANGLSAHVSLGIPTPADIPAHARRRSAAAVPPSKPPAQRRLL